MSTYSDTPHHTFASLTDAQVMDMRRAYRAGGVLIRELAARYGISQNTAGHVIAGRTYKHLPVLGPPETPNKRGPRIGVSYAKRSAVRKDARTPLPARETLIMSQPPPSQFRTATAAPAPSSEPWEERGERACIEPLPDPTAYTGLRAKLAAKRREERKIA